MSTGDPRARTADLRPGGFCSSCGHALEAGATVCTNCGAARVDSTDRDATIVIGPDQPTEVLRERTYEYDEPMVVDDGPVVVADDTNWALWALGALGLLILLLLLFLGLRDDDGDDDVSTANGPVATVPGDTVVTPAPVVTAPPQAVTAPPATSAPVTNAPTAGNSGGTSTGSGPVTPTQSGAGFELTDVQIEDDGGRFAGTAQIRNTRDEARSARITIKLFKGGQQVGTLTGTSSSIPANSSAAVPLTSSDPYVDGVDRYEFTANEA